MFSLGNCCRQYFSFWNKKKKRNKKSNKKQQKIIYFTEYQCLWLFYKLNTNLIISVKFIIIKIEGWRGMWYKYVSSHHIKTKEQIPKQFLQEKLSNLLKKSVIDGRSDWTDKAITILPIHYLYISIKVFIYLFSHVLLSCYVRLHQIIENL